MVTLSKEDLDKISQMLAVIPLGQSLPIWKFLSDKVTEQVAKGDVTTV